MMLRMLVAPFYFFPRATVYPPGCRFAGLPLLANPIDRFHTSEYSDQSLTFR